jgi:hypothetical protein
MPNKHVMYLIVERLAQFCRKFIVIDQPDFSAAEHIYDLGLKMTQMMMASHTTRLATRDIMQVLWDMRLGNFVVYVPLAIYWRGEARLPNAPTGYQKIELVSFRTFPSP